MELASVITALIVIVLVIVFLAIFFTFVPVGLWISAMAAGVRVGIFQLVGMRIRRVTLQDHQPHDQGLKAGLDVAINKLRPTIWPAVTLTAWSTP